MKNYLKSNLKTKVILFLIILVAGSFRLYGLNWDQNQHLHPDERFLTMVTGDMKWPSSFTDYLDPKTSSLNPYNAGYGFFVYGTLPLTIVKSASNLFTIDKFDYNNITLAGRIISAIFDLGIVISVYKVAQNIFDKKTGLTAAFFYSTSVLPIQLSHFYATDTFANFFTVLSFYLLVLLTKPRKLTTLLFLACALGIVLGLSLASKISSLLFLPVIFLGLIFKTLREKNLLPSVYCLLPIVFLSYLTLRIADPHVFTNQFIENIKQLKSFDDPNGLLPPAIQWIKTKPIIFPLQNMILWGFGSPLGILTIAGVVYSFINAITRFKQFNNLTIKQWSNFLILFWTLFLFLYQGFQFSKAMRYFLPIYPFLAILAANFSHKIILSKTKPNILYKIYYILILIYPLSFISIYSRPHSRVSASEWIYQNIPAGSVISCEHWDDCLPLSLDQKNYTFYQTETLTLFDPDIPQKWQKINQQLAKVDYLIMSSNRLWGSIPKVPERYPVTSQFYSDLFNEKLNFTKVAEITSYPTVPILNVPIPDDSADESFTVYDHPKVLIYKRNP